MDLIQIPHPWPWRMRGPEELPHHVRDKLAYTETEILGGQVHQAVMYEPILSALGGLGALILLVPRVPAGFPVVGNFLALAFLALLGRAAFKWWEWGHTLFFFTPFRIVYVHGIFTRQYAMLPIGKVTDMGYERTPGGQIFGYGKFVIESAGQEQALRDLNFVADPDNTYRQIQDWLFGKGTQHVRIVDVEMANPHKTIPVNVRNWPSRRPDGSGSTPRPEGGSGSGKPWWTNSEE